MKSTKTIEQPITQLPPIIDHLRRELDVIIDSKPLSISVLNNDTILVFNPKKILPSFLKERAIDICNAVDEVSRKTGARRYSMAECPNYIIPSDEEFSEKMETEIQRLLLR